MKFKCEHVNADYLKLKRVEEGIQFELYENEMRNFAVISLENIEILIEKLKELKEG